jgi:hypothetical protein
VNTDEIKAHLADENPDAILWDGLEDALVGLARRCGQPVLAVYDYNKCVEVFMARDAMSHEDAVEWIEFNVVGGWLGPSTPIMLTRHQED